MARRFAAAMGCLVKCVACALLAIDASAAEVAVHGTNKVGVPPLNSLAFRIPGSDKDEMREIEIELINSPNKLPNVTMFRVEKRFWGEVMNYFTACKIDQEPVIGSADIASVRITMETGEVMRIAIHGVSKNAGFQFSIMGVRLRSNDNRPSQNFNTSAFEMLIRRIFFEQTGHVTHRLSAEMIRDLKLQPSSN